MKRPILKIAFTIFLFIVGVFFTTVLHKFGAAVAGNAGTGSRFFLYLVDGPESLCLLIWPTLFPLLPWTRVPKVAITVFALSLVPVAWATIFLNLEGLQDDVIHSIWVRQRGLIYVFSGIYLLPTFLGLLTGTSGAIATFIEWKKKARAQQLAKGAIGRNRVSR